jgi:hypothetical protein
MKVRQQRQKLGARWAAIAVLSIAAGLVGCSESPQTLGEVRSDQAPHTGSVVKSHMVPGWTAGDRKTWEAQLKVRAQAQNEYTRVQ